MQNNLKVWRAKTDVTQEELAFKLAAYFDCRIEDIFEPEFIEEPAAES